jgi:Flp pilus assembly protein TadG
MYMPLLFFAIFMSVQFALMFFGNQAAAASAREAARVARAGGGTPEALGSARQRGTEYATTVGKGVLLDPQVQVQVQRVGATAIRVVVDGGTLQVVPGLPAPRVHQVVQGPVESFRPDR